MAEILRFLRNSFYNHRVIVRSSLIGWVFLLALYAGCRGVEPEPAPQHRHSLFAALSAQDGVMPRAGWRGVELGPVDPELIIQAEAGQRTSYNIRLEPEDSIELFSRWSGRSVRDLRRMNPSLTRWTPGELFHIELSPGEAARFNGARKAYLAGQRLHEPKELSWEKTKKYRVKESETLRDILARYRTTLDALEQLNPGLSIRGIQAGDLLVIPVGVSGS